MLVTVVTWLWWLDPGFTAVTDESFWLGIDRPWTYCIATLQTRGKHTFAQRCMNEHLHKHINHLQWKSLQTLKVVWCFESDRIQKIPPPPIYKVSPLHSSALLIVEKAVIKFSEGNFSFQDSLSWYSYILFRHTCIPVLLFQSPSSFTSILPSYLLISTCLDVSFPPASLSPTVPPTVLPSCLLPSMWAK